MSFAITQGLFLLDIVDYYAILGLPVGAESKTVRKAYLRIAQRLHPDTCKAKDDEEKKLASEFLSKLVNPAYEKLSKQTSWSEYQVILNQLSKQLSNRDTGTLKLKFPSAQALHDDTSGDIATSYKSQVEAISKENYLDMSLVLETIAELSELNLVYLKAIGKAGLSAKSTTPPQRNIYTPSNNTAPPTNNQTPPEPSPAPPSTAHTTKSTVSSSLEAAIWRGEQHLEKKNYAKAVLEFRDAIKLDPNCVKAHALMGLSYLEQKQVAMAKVHIKKAYMAKPSDPLARQAKEALEKEMGNALDTQSGMKRPVEDKKSGLFGGLFGGKKK